MPVEEVVLAGNITDFPFRKSRDTLRVSYSPKPKFLCWRITLEIADLLRSYERSAP